MRVPAVLRRLAGGLARWTGVVGLNYHRIGDGRRSRHNRGLWSATRDGFDEQVRWLAAHFDIISPRDLSYVVRIKRGRHVLITFDDGYADNHAEAFPVLTAHRVPATFFIATGFIDKPHLPWWDEIAWMVRGSERPRLELPNLPPISVDEPEREQAVRALLRAYKRLPAGGTAAFLDEVAAATGTGRPAPESGASMWMTWDMLREMHAAGMTIGGHTVQHQVLSRMSRLGQQREISGCGARLLAELGVPMRTFSYPVGSRDAFNDDTRACLREAGVRTAFSYYGGFRPLSAWDDLDIPRIPIEQETSLDELRAVVMFPWSTED